MRFLVVALALHTCVLVGAHWQQSAANERRQFTRAIETDFDPSLPARESAAFATEALEAGPEHATGPLQLKPLALPRTSITNSSHDGSNHGAPGSKLIDALARVVAEDAAIAEQKKGLASKASPASVGAPRDDAPSSERAGAHGESSSGSGFGAQTNAVGGPGGRDTGTAASDHGPVAHIISGYADDCGFPFGSGSVRNVVVILIAKVKADGTARDVVVVSDPGRGFGRMARKCALQRHYLPARDPKGVAIEADTMPFVWRFF